MWCTPSYKDSYGKCNDQQNPAFIEYFKIPLCKSGPDSQLINICICLVMSLAVYIIHMWQFYLHNIQL